MGKHFRIQDEPLGDVLTDDLALAYTFIVGLVFLLLEATVLLLGAI